MINFSTPMDGLIKQRLASFLAGYFKHLFLSQSVFVGLFLIFLPVIYLSNTYSGFSDAFAKILTIYGNIFSIDSSDDFVKTTIGLVITIFPLVSYMLAKIIKPASSNQFTAIKAKIFIFSYLALVVINTLAMWQLDSNFSILVPILLLITVIFAYVMYLMSVVCDLIAHRLQPSTGSGYESFSA